MSSRTGPPFLNLDGWRLTVVHAAAAIAVALVAFVVLRLPELRDAFPNDSERASFVRGLPVASLLASLVAIWLGVVRDDRRRAFVVDALTWPALGLAAAATLFLPMPQPFAGLAYVTVVMMRFAPLIVRAVTDRSWGPGAAFALAFGIYASLGIWGVGVVRAGGDPAHYLAGTEALRLGTLDLTRVYAGPLFEAITGAAATARDIEIHAVRVGAELRLAQGYLFPAILVPGWALAERIGAMLIVALIAAAAMAQAWLFLRETVGDRRLTRLCWALLAFSWPFAGLATHAYPSVLAALVTLVMFRLLFTAPVRRPLAAGMIAIVLLLLVPRNAIAPLILLPFAWAASRAIGARYTAGLVAATIATAVVNLGVFGSPIPYAGYVAGIGTYGDTIHVRPDTALLGMLFDRAFGIAGTAPWVFIGAIGVIPLLRTRAMWAIAALAVVFGARLALSTFRLWEGGWGPPNRYIVDVLPLWMPFVVAGLAQARQPIIGAVAAALLLLSIPMTALYHANPGLSYSTGENKVVKILRPIAPLPQSLLPSFSREPDGAHARGLAAAAVVVALVLAGWRASRPGGTRGPTAGPAIRPR